MTIWHEMQDDGLILYGCLLQGGDLKRSSFPPEYKKHLAVAKQSLSFIFRSVEKNAKGYDEAHMEIGDSLFSGFQLDSDTIVIFLSEHDVNTLHIRQFIEDNKKRFFDLSNAS